MLLLNEKMVQVDAFLLSIYPNRNQIVSDNLVCWGIHNAVAFNYRNANNMPVECEFHKPRLDSTSYLPLRPSG